MKLEPPLPTLAACNCPPSAPGKFFTYHKPAGWLRKVLVDDKPLVGSLYADWSVREYAVFERVCSNGVCHVPYQPDDDRVHMQTRSVAFTWAVSHHHAT